MYLEWRLLVPCYFFKIEQEYWPTLKTFMVYLSMIPETEMIEIPMDEYVWKTLNNI